MARKVKELRDLEIDEISLVDKGANQHARTVIAKRHDEEDKMDEYFDAEGNPVDVASLELGDVVYNENGEAFELEADDETEVEQERELATVGKRADDVNPFQVSKSETSSVSSLREAFSKALTDEDRDGVISKALDLIGEQEKIAKAAAATAEAERQMRLDREYTEVAKSYDVGIAPEVLGPVLKRAAESLSREDCEVLSKALQAGSEATGQLFEEIGKRGGGANSDVFNTVEAYLDETVSKGETGSRAEQVSKVFEENPNAYDEYLAEQRQGR
jgi:hypothetical protein